MVFYTWDVFDTKYCCPRYSKKSSSTAITITNRFEILETFDSDIAIVLSHLCIC